MTHAPQLRPAKLPQGLPGITKITRYTREMDASWRALKLILAAALLQSSSASVLNVTTPEVEVGKTANVSLECFNPNPAPGISDIVMIRILKWHHDEWNSVAELQRGDDEEVTQTSDEVSTEGTIGSVDESFLRLTWPVATNNTLGRYRCDFVSLTLQESVMWQKSVPIFVRRKRVLTVQMLRETVEKNKRNGFQQLRSQKQDLLENITATGELLKAGFESLLESELQVLNKTVEENKNDLDLQNQDIENVKASVENSTRELLQLLSSQNQEIQENLTATIEDLEEGFGNQIQVLNHSFEEKKKGDLQQNQILEEMKEALEENKRECLQQKQDILDNVTAIVEALKADYEYKLSTVKRQPQPQSCTDGKILGLQPLIGLSNGQLAVCDSVIDSYAWTVIQRRTSADVDFFRGWEDYKNGFGDLSGNFWFGLEKVHQLTSRGRYELRIDMTYKGKYYYARYESFLLYGEAKQYKIEISGFSGNVVDKMAYHNGQAFSTKDRDNDPSDGSCAEKWHGAWWYKTCHHVNLNGVWGSTEFAKGVNWKSVTGWEDSVSFSEMKIRPLSH